MSIPNRIVMRRLIKDSVGTKEFLLRVGVEVEDSC